MATDELTIDKDQIRNHLVFPEKDVKQIIYSFIQIFSNQWSDERTSSDYNSEEAAVLVLARKTFQGESLRYLLVDAPVETMEMVVKKSIQIASLIHGVTNLGDVMGTIETLSVKMAVNYGLNALMQNEIMVAPGAFATDYIVIDDSSAKMVLQYILIFKPTGQNVGQIAIEFYSPATLLIPKSQGSPGMTYGTPNDLTSDLPPFIITVKGQIQRDDYKNYQWVNPPDIVISFPDSVPDLGFRPESFWQRHLWQPLENEVQDTLVLLQKFIPSASGIVNSLNDIWQNINQAGSSIGNSLLEFLGNAGASLVGFVSGDPQPSNQPANLASSNNQDLPLPQLTPPQPTPSPAPTPQPDTSYIDSLARQLAALLEQIDNVSEEIDLLSSQQTPPTTAFLPEPGQNDDLASNDPLPPVSSSTPATSSNTLASYQPLNNSPSAPPPVTQILVSEVQTDSQNSAAEEYIELYNPNNFTVNLGGFVLRKKTASGASESVLVNSKKFQGNVAAFGYFLITPPSTSTGNLHYSSASYSIAQTNSILLYDSYERLLDTAENVIHPPTHSFGRKLTGLANPEVKYQQTFSSTADFEIQIPTPGADNQRDTSSPATTTPSTTTPATSTPSTTTPATTTPTTSTPPILLISEAQIRDASSTNNDFVEIFNPNNQAIDITDFQLKKQTSTGTSTGYSLRVFPANSVIPAMGYFLWANSDYILPGLTPDATSTQTLATNNSVALFYTDHATIIDQVAWGSSANPFVETAPFTPNPANDQTITRQQDSSGNYLDTNNNANDFILASSTPTNSLGQTIQPTTSTPPTTTTPAYDPTAPVITDLQANPAADRKAVDLWWSNASNNNVNYYLINYDNQTFIFNTTSVDPTIFATTVTSLIGGQSYQFTVQAITSSGATSGPSNIATATPLLAFQDNGDGTVNDLYTGLMWPKDGAGLAANNGQPLTWFEAKDFCDQLVMNGYDDWRLPNIKELASIIKYQKSPSDGTMIDSYYFQNIASAKYWSSSYKHFTWGWDKWFTADLDFNNGFIGMETLDAITSTTTFGYLLPVRGNSTVIPASGFDEPQTGCSLGYQGNSADVSFIDLCSGLMWTPSFSSEMVSQTKAVENASNSTIFSYDNWRLPNIREIIMTLNNPYESSAQPNWTMTNDYQGTGSGWMIDSSLWLCPGQTQTKPVTNSYYFRFVRNQ
ncbi:MAG: DUF1566 domain-containing protein [Candidatus Gribaldobacteria bacterium]|nr:DUF1566 domain-containing protein [Candidatus Gribaldobacteria bacterium]